MTWTDKEIQLLKNCVTIEEAKLLFSNRSEQSIYSKCRRLDICLVSELGILWTNNEVKVLEDNKHLSARELQKLFTNRTYSSIQNKCFKMNINIGDYFLIWTQEEIDSINNNQEKTLNDICELLPNKSLDNVYSYIKKHHLSFKRDRKIDGGSYLDSKYSTVDGKLRCNKCGIEKSYNNDNFVVGSNSDYTCRACRNKIVNIKKYKSKYNIEIDFDKMFDTYTPEQWYDFYYKNQINKFPYEISRNKEYMNRIMRYALVEILNIKSRDELLFIETKDLEKIRLRGFFSDNTISGTIDILFPEYNIKSWELNVVPKYFWRDKNNVDEFMLWFVENNIDLSNINIKTDIPNIFNREYMEEISNFKMNACISLYEHYNTYYEWINHLFPEWCLNPEDFKVHIAKDGVKLNSREELLVYEFVKYNYDINIKSIGLNRKDKYFNEECNENYVPDFKVVDFLKPIIIEYYGLYKPDNKSEYIQSYINKTHRKNKFYKSNPDIHFIDIYPPDLKNNFEGVRNKLTSFFMENFNLDINEIKTDSKKV